MPSCDRPEVLGLPVLHKLTTVIGVGIMAAPPLLPLSPLMREHALSLCDGRSRLGAQPPG